MSYIKNEMGRKFKIGDWAVTARKVDCFNGYFQKGTKVKVIEINPLYGYGLEDEEGHQIIDTGWNSIE